MLQNKLTVIHLSQLIDSQRERNDMKWSEVIHLSKGTLVRHIGSDRQAEVRDILLDTRMIIIRYLDNANSKEERVNPSEFIHVLKAGKPQTIIDLR